MYSHQQQTQQQQGPEIVILPKDAKVERTLEKVLAFQSQINAKQSELDVCDKMSKRKIVCFGAEQIGNQSMFHDYRHKKRPIDAEFNEIPPRELYQSRLFARDQLPQHTEALEYVQMEQAEYVHKLQKQCTTKNHKHRYVVFADPESDNYKKGGIDIYSMRCLHCFTPIPDLGMLPNVVTVYHTSMDFLHGQRLRISQVSDLQPLY